MAAPSGSRRAVVTRRSLVVGAVGVAAVGALGAAVDLRALPGRSTLYRVLGLDGHAGRIPDVRPVPMRSGSFTSRARRGRRVGWTVAAPTSDHALPVVVALHGYGDDHADLFGHRLGLDRFLAEHVDHGGAPFAIAAVDGGDRYWHRRADGDDPASMVLDEFLPLLARQGLDTGRLGFTGYSMGGYGALHFAGVLGRHRVRVVSALSPALWTTAGDTARGAFDDPTDFAANTVTGRQRALDGIPVRIDCGTGDGFEPAVRTYVDGFTRRPAGGFEAGGHDMAFWRRLAPDHVAFLGRHLTSAT
ncbi:esterase [Curtobacterium sp. MCBD17_013]|uniref:alpha/beta hydrolase n=1 Tax=Curtobacterium sp. MCBD17_013 TaxID=2175668 RepID=UPI000DAA849A|nr:alpha/beta hydrolase-fold protein [Curtobacterium sp. MCBD17_013]PZF64477.1 esterase [Curtobacterium sp. MCBD17_013]